MAACGIITIGGVERAWASPTIYDLEQFERDIGPLTDLTNVNSVAGRTYLAWLCLRAADPQLELVDVRTISAAEYPRLWPMIAEAIPLWAAAPGPQEGPPDPPAPAAAAPVGQSPRLTEPSPDSSDFAVTGTAGPPASPGSSE